MSGTVACCLVLAALCCRYVGTLDLANDVAPSLRIMYFHWLPEKFHAITFFHGLTRRGNIFVYDVCLSPHLTRLESDYIQDSAKGAE